MPESQTSVEVLPAGHPAVEAWVGSQLVAVCVVFPSFVHVMVVPTVIVMLGLPLASLKPQFEALLHSPLVSQIERSEEHTSELQSRFDLVCRLLLEKKKALVST